MAKPGRKKRPRRYPKMERCLTNEEFAQTKKHLHLTWDEMAHLLGLTPRFCQKLGRSRGKRTPVTRLVHNAVMYILHMNPVICPKTPSLPILPEEEIPD